MFLKEVGDCETGLKRWVQVVLDNLCLADLFPDLAFLHMHDNLGIRVPDHVYILQVVARDKQLKLA